MKNKNNYLWVLLLIGFGFVIYWFFIKKDTALEQNTIQPPAATSSLDGVVETSATDYQPQHSKTNPRPESVDPFTPHKDFEVLIQGSKNKTDFDFIFENHEQTPVFKLENGAFDFVLKGKLLTSIAIEDNGPLELQLYKNDQISFTKRTKSFSFDLPYIKETEKKNNNDKATYSFDFEKRIQTESGLYYFLIIPAGRNRVLHTGKVEVKD